MFIALLIAQSDIGGVDNFPMYAGRTRKADVLIQPYVECAFRAAGKLERSGEAADTVAKAAIDFCFENRDKLQAEVDAEQAFAGSIESDALKSFDEWLIRQISLRIVGKRAIAKQ